MLVLLTALLLLLSYNLNNVSWFLNSPPPVVLIWLGAVLGAVLAFSRFSPFASLIYILLSGLLIGMQTSNGLLPGQGSLAGKTFWNFLDYVNLHLRLFYLQFTSDWQANFHGFLVIYLLFWLCGAWLTWSTLRLKRPLAGLIPAGLMLGYESSLRNKDINIMAIFALLLVLLAAAASFRERHDNWEKLKISTPWELGEWPFSALMIATLVGAIALSFPYVATNEGRQKISDMLKPEPLTVQVSSYKPYQFEKTEEQILIGIFDLQTLGTPPSRGTEAVMYLRVNDPPPQLNNNPDMEDAATPRYYLRNFIYTTYTGWGWETEKISPETTFETPTAGRRLLVQEIDILVKHSPGLFAVNLPIRSDPDTTLTVTTPDGSPLLTGRTSSYSVQSLVSDLQKNELENAGSEYPPLITQTYLQLPAELPELVSLLAEEITRTAATPLQKTLAVQDFLQQNYIYDLDTPPPAAGQDVVEYFLFHTKSGFCSYYASAMIVLLRSSGVPARLAVGYTAWQYDPLEEHYIVPASGAHAWVEVYFPGYGWVEFEPTPIHPLLNYVEDENLSLSETQESAKAIQKKDRLILVGLGVLIVIILLIVLLFWLPINWLPVFGGPSGSPAASLYQQMRNSLARAGLSAPASVTPNEFLQIAASRIGAFPVLETAVKQTTSLYVDTLFRPDPPDEQVLAEARQAWRASSKERRSFITQKYWKI